MYKFVMVAFIAFAAFVSISAKPSYVEQSYSAPAYVYSAPIYARPANAYSSKSASAAAAASVSSSVAAYPGYVYHVPSYVIDGGHSGYSIYDPNYISYNSAY